MNTNPIGDTKTTATSNSTNTLDRPSTTNNTSSSTSHHANHNNNNNTHIVPLHRVEGIFAVYKPIDWTSNDVVSYLRGILERDARERGAKHAKVGSRGRSNKLETVKVGHGGTLDPLATGVLVIGVGSGTKQMSR
jgi:tRNA U55 pseudouridine synthase TruB